MSFRNPIVAGTVLVRAAIESAGYVAGSTGWMIGRDGTAEFNEVTVRGAVEISGSNSLLMYSAAPALGDLLMALAPVSGADEFGNAYQEGLTVGDSTGKQIFITMQGGSPLIYLLSGRPQITAVGGSANLIQEVTQGSGASGYEQLQVVGAADSTQLDRVGSTWLSSSQDGSRIPQIQEFYLDPLGSFHTYRVTSYAGVAISAGSIVAVHPGTGNARTNVAVAETWQSAASLINATLWTTTGVTNPLRFRLEPQGSGGGCVRLDGELLTTGAGPWPANATIFMLPTGYKPSTTHPFITRSDIAVAAGQNTVNVIGGGSVQNGQTFTAAAQRLYFDGIVVPLD